MSQNLKERIESFPVWHYEFDLDGIKTPIHDATKVNRHIQRYNYFFKPLLSKYNGSLKGKRILDLACNAGYWSLKAIENECEYVLGIDVRQMHIDQANLVFEVKGIDRKRYEFVNSDIYKFNFSEYGHFDIVFCFGIFYHINRPIELFEIMSFCNVVLLDTSVLNMAGPFIELKRESTTDPRNSIGHELIFMSSRDAILEMAHQFGYTTTVLKPQFSDYTGCYDYETDRRLAFICEK